MKLDFKKIPDVQEFPPIPEGQYLCQLESVEESATQTGNEMWTVRFVVEDGPHRGRYLWDRLVFSDAAFPRVKLFASSLGIDVSGELDFNPQLVTGRSCYVTVGIEEYEGKQRNKVPFHGFAPADTPF